MTDPRRATLAALQRSTGGGTLVYRTPEHEPPVWTPPPDRYLRPPAWRRTALELSGGATLRALTELRTAVIGRGATKRHRERFQIGLRLLESEGVIMRRGESLGVIVVDHDQLAEVLAEDPQVVTQRHA